MDCGSKPGNDESQRADRLFLRGVVEAAVGLGRSQPGLDNFTAAGPAGLFFGSAQPLMQQLLIDRQVSRTIEIGQLQRPHDDARRAS